MRVILSGDGAKMTSLNQPAVRGYGVGRARHPFASRLAVSEVPREGVVQGGLGDRQPGYDPFGKNYTFSNIGGIPVNTPGLDSQGRNDQWATDPPQSGFSGGRYHPYPTGRYAPVDVGLNGWGGGGGGVARTAIAVASDIGHPPLLSIREGDREPLNWDGLGWWPLPLE